jgi:hypothetical protein
MSRHVHVVAALLLLVLMSYTTVWACTVFSFANENALLFGNNEDYHLEPVIWFLEGRDPYHNVLCLGFDQGALQGGMNDAGLCYDATAGTGILLNWHKELAQAPGNWPTLVLQQCETVEDVEAWIRRYDFSSSGMAQFLYFDKNGDSLIVTSTHSGEIAFLKKSAGARVITNFNVTDRSVGTYPCWRYDTAADLVRRLELDLATPSIAYFRAILNGVHIPGYTAYSNIFDVANMTAYIYRACNFQDVRVIDLLAVFEQGPPGSMTLEDYFESAAEN